jgi:hypothetical protein
MYPVQPIRYLNNLIIYFYFRPNLLFFGFSIIPYIFNITRSPILCRYLVDYLKYIKDKAKEDLDSERDNLLNELEESKVVYIREKTPVAKKQKAKNIIEAVVPKRNIYLIAKRV